MKKIIYMLVFVFLALPFYGQTGTVLEDLLNPLTMEIDVKQIYFTEGAKIYIYNLSDLKLVNVFGKAGAGPQEFLVPPQVPLQVNVATDKVIVNSQGKVSFWKKDGTYISEKKVQIGVFSGFFKPLSDGYVGLRLIVEDDIMYFGVDYYDKDFKRQKLLLKQKHFFQLGKKMNPIGRIPIFSTWKGRVYVEDKDGIIHVYDKTGKQFPPIAHKFKPFKINQDHKERILNFYKSDPGIKQYWSFFKDNMEFPSHFSNIQTSIVTDDMVYMQTYRRDGEKAEFIIYGTDGKFIGTRMIPFRDQNIVRPYPYSISRNKLYQVVENEDDEWEMIITGIK
ncbi:MAG: hypothetical protein KAS21_07795 [Candidatus Aminicenantes bacterium]|nr:hypothetical protein [Candidatus Aminicenantes bacterium]